MLRVRNLQIAYKQNTARVSVIRDLNLEFQAGKLIMLAGRNGSGKSSLLRVLAGLQKADGDVIIHNQSLQGRSEPEIASLVSIMFSTPPNVELTLAGELVLTAMQRQFSPFKFDFSAEWTEVARCMKLTGTLDFINRPFNSLSDGEKQKVMLARCLAQNTSLLLLDEPLAFLDYPSRLEMIVLLKKIAVAENKIVIFSSHDLEISLSNCSDLLLLKGDGSWRKFEGDELSTLKPIQLF